jgi:hypothetical protein
MLAATAILIAFSGLQSPAVRGSIDRRFVEPVLRELGTLRPVRLGVVDADTGFPVPARITITDGTGRPVSIHGVSGASTAVRSGVLYTSDGEVMCELSRGEYFAYATRGIEWSLGRTRLSVGDGVNEALLTIRRELNTTGFIACDTHVHTRTFSGHGDASVAERLITLAGEGVEFAVATDHNHNTDYRPEQTGMGLARHFTAVTGNEVSTAWGHFNAFPLDPSDAVPRTDLGSWVRLVDGMRSKGAKVVVLNHPRWPEVETGPFGVYGLDRYTGRLAGGSQVPFDAMELVNSQHMPEDPQTLLADWFALLNRGESIVAVGASDSHTVAHPVGQGRTFVVSRTDDPADIDVDEICEHLVAGRSSVSLGIFADATIDGRFGMGDLVPARAGRVDLSLRVAAPAWVRPRDAAVYVNGRLVARQPVPVVPDTATDVRMTFTVDAAAPHDAWLVCVVTGDGVDGPWWPTTRAFTLAATNPIRLDVDGDARYSSPRATAVSALQELLRSGRPLSDVSVPASCDDAVAVAFLDLLHDELLSLARAGGAEPSAALREEARSILEQAGRNRAIRSEWVAAYLNTLPAPGG